MNKIGKEALIVHDLEEPGSDYPGDLGDKVAHPLQACTFVIIRGHFITECDPRDRITGKSNEKEDLDP